MRTYRFHDQEGRRLAIFGEVKEDSLEVFILTCARGDHFNKELARSVYAAYQSRGMKGCKAMGFDPEVITFAVTKGQERNQFNEFCWENFHNPYAHTILQLEIPNCRLEEVLELLKSNKLI